MTNEEKFNYYVKTYIHREGIDTLVNWCKCNGYFKQPASTKYHDSVEGGLLQHSLNFLTYFAESMAHYYGCKEFLDTDGYLKFLKTKYLNGNVEVAESVVIVSLFHDICKCDLYRVDTKNVKQPDGSWQKVSYYTYNEEQFRMGHGVKSMYLTFKYIYLTDLESQAIRYHMGGFGEFANAFDPDVSAVFSDSPFCMYAHIADMQAAYL